MNERNLGGGESEMRLPIDQPLDNVAIRDDSGASNQESSPDDLKER